MVKMQDRECPNFWENCSECAYERECKAGLYHGETIIEIAAIVEKQIVKEVVKSVEGFRGTWSEKFNAMSENERWGDYRKYHAPNLHHKEPIPLDGPSSPGGGSKSNVKKSNKGCKPTVYQWGVFK